MTPAWDWVAVHAVHHRPPRPQAVIAFAGRGGLGAPALRVARVASIGTPDDVFTTSALTWGHSILASVQYSDAQAGVQRRRHRLRRGGRVGRRWAGGHRARRLRRGARARPERHRACPLGQPGGSWPVAEAGPRLAA